MIKGFICGSFRPLHLGHMALIDYAKSNCDHLTILITTLPDETIPYKYRLKWVLSTYLDDPKVDILADIIIEPDIKGDALSGWWGMYVKTKFGQFDRVFTSEDYGDIFAKSMGAEHWKFNQSRTIVPVSATIIRQKPLKYWDYLNNFAKDYFVKKIAIVGTESTGKTTMAQQLAKHYNTVWVPEVGRELIPNVRGCSIEDLELVASEHAKSILKHIRLANKILFFDTDLNITQSYSEFLFNKILKVEPWIEKANEVDYYLYLDPSAPWIDDGTRLDLYERNQLNTNHWKYFKDKKAWSIFSFDNSIDSFMAYEKRFHSVIDTIDNFIKKY
jgi:HTH-type transcriptional repressor of NAD biosynthesis genes